MTDYESYKEIMEELLKPIMPKDLDPDTLKRLYESKAVYLENLRVRCFWELNTKQETPFTPADYEYILKAIDETKQHLRGMILMAITDHLSRRKVS